MIAALAHPSLALENPAHKDFDSGPELIPSDEPSQYMLLGFHFKSLRSGLHVLFDFQHEILESPPHLFVVRFPSLSEAVPVMGGA